MTVVETARGRVEIRELARIREMQAAEEIQLRVWGVDIIPHPKEILIPMQHEGGLLAGAFAGDEMVGLVFGFPTRDPLVQHSQMLATLEHWRGQGIGAQMKWFQRRWCLERGIRRVRWTVDPLRANNAALNIQRLGGTAAVYLTDYYGPMLGIDAGAPTDRLVVEWQLDSPHVIARAASAPQDPAYADAEPANAVEDGCPVSLRTNLAGARIRIHLPDDFIRLSKTDPPLALEWRMQTRTLFQHYFGLGYVITGFTRACGPAYLLEKYNNS